MLCPANVREGLREVKLDVQEGADIVMVKPALPYLDVIAKVKEAVDVPVIVAGGITDPVTADRFVREQHFTIQLIRIRCRRVFRR